MGGCLINAGKDAGVMDVCGASGGRREKGFACCFFYSRDVGKSPLDNKRHAARYNEEQRHVTTWNGVTQNKDFGRIRKEAYKSDPGPWKSRELLLASLIIDGQFTADLCILRGINSMVLLESERPTGK